MILVVKKSQLKGTVAIPASKSHTIRAVAVSSLADGKSVIFNPLTSNDTLSAVECYRQLGAIIDTGNNQKWTVSGTSGKISPPPETIDVGNSGTTLHIAMGTAALCNKNVQITLTGDRQIQSRPVGPLIESLTELGADAKSLKGNGRAPVSIRGKMFGGKTTIQCPTSQYLTSLLLACPLAEKDTQITVPLLHEPDYAKMTMDWLYRQKIKYEHDNMRRFKIFGRQKYTCFKTVIPADFSSATFFLCAAVILNADITLTGLDFADSQPDKAVVDYLRQMGAEISFPESGVRIIGSNLTAATIDMNRTPDAICAMAVAGMFARGTTKLINVPQARSKETDRISCMAMEMTKLGAEVEELPDGLIIHGNTKIHAADLHGHGDHRIVMALSLAGLAADGTTTIDTAEAMSVTFPDFAALMNSLGADMTITDR